ncbi:hypothetical protein PLEOSDRAFT_169180 [Pleurotus ostreatus PC15]|uniref:Uncharacterized protein n=1 Tax=Pleurotus ostreatus (strain PC15) TaxID=1137138 RepID=A0A067NEX8_PLEO1|nr:hypothetical protein PLEOSDRAFT_169180 [Pleurotus ostreatus PC15]
MAAQSSQDPHPPIHQPHQPPSLSTIHESLGAILANQEQMSTQYSVFDARLRTLEKENFGPRVAAQSRGGSYPRRGRNLSAKRAHLRRGRGGGDPAVSRPNAGPDTDPDEDAELEDLGSDPKLLSEVAKEARKVLQSRQKAKFRELCGVKGKAWPRPGEVRRNLETNEVYLAPDFEADVTTDVNMGVIIRVAQKTYEDLEPWDNRPAALKSLDFIWNQSTIEKFAKTSFRTFKRQYEANVNVAKAEAEQIRQRTTRWLQRRKDKCERLLLGVPTFFQRHDLDPTPFIVQEHMSDEASGPEDDTEEHAAWKLRMAAYKGMDDVDESDDIARLTFTEVIWPEWRSAEFQLSNIFHELDTIQWDMRNAKEKARFKTLRVTDSGRSSARPPLAAPYDFGIDKVWFETHGKSAGNAVLVEDWFTYGNPPGFGVVDGDCGGESGDEGQRYEQNENCPDGLGDDEQ